MAQVISFQEDNHEYRLPDGTPVPSVSEILRFMSRELYGGIMQYTLDHAADRGTRIHKECEILDKYGTTEADADIVPYLQAYVKFKKEHNPQWDSIERPGYHATMMYAGTTDRIGTMDGKSCILDIKVQEQIKKPMVKAQLNGYALMFAQQPDALYCLQLKKDGTYRLHEVEKDIGEFMACYTLHKALEKKPRKKKGVNDGNTDE